MAMVRPRRPHLRRRLVSRWPQGVNRRPLCIINNPNHNNHNHRHLHHHSNNNSNIRNLRPPHQHCPRPHPAIPTRLSHRAGVMAHPTVPAPYRRYPWPLRPLGLCEITPMHKAQTAVQTTNSDGPPFLRPPHCCQALRQRASLNGSTVGIQPQTISGRHSLAPQGLSPLMLPTRSDPSPTAARQCSLQFCHHPHLRPHPPRPRPPSFLTPLDSRVARWIKSQGEFMESMLRMSPHDSLHLNRPCHLRPRHHMHRTVITRSVPRICPMRSRMANLLESAFLDGTRRINISSAPTDRVRQPLPRLRLDLRTALSPMVTMRRPLHSHQRLRATATRRQRTWIAHLGMRSTSNIVDGLTTSYRRLHRRQWGMEDTPTEHRPRLRRRPDPIPVPNRQPWISSPHRGTKTMPTVCRPSPRLSQPTNNVRILAIMAAAAVVTITSNSIIILRRTAMEDRRWLESTRWTRTRRATIIISTCLRPSLPVSGRTKLGWDRRPRSIPSTLRIQTRPRRRHQSPRSLSGSRMRQARRT